MLIKDWAIFSKIKSGQMNSWGSPGGVSGKEPAWWCRSHKGCRFNPWVWKILWRRTWRHSPVFLAGESHAQRSLVGYSPWGRKESDTTEATYVHCMAISGVSDFQTESPLKQTTAPTLHSNPIIIPSFLGDLQPPRFLSLPSLPPLSPSPSFPVSLFLCYTFQWG